MKIKFKRDTSFRKQFFVPASFAHPAKMDAQLLIWIVEHYTEAGETILDPMAGMGTTMLACTLGRDVVLIELEEKFCKMMRDNWEQVKMRPQLGSTMGSCKIIQGDARQLEGLCDKIISSPPYSDISMGGGLNTKPPRGGHNDQSGRSPDSPSQKGLVDKIVTSPPFAGNKGGLKSAEGFMYGDDELGKRMMGGIKGGTGSHPDNIDSLPYGEIDKCIFSPPYEAMVNGSGEGPLVTSKKNPGYKPMPNAYGQIDKIVTSPPYEASVTGKDGIDWSKGTRKDSKLGYGYIKPRDRSKEPAFDHLSIGGAGFNYGDSKDNIGNLKSQSYLEDYWDILDIIACMPYNIVNEVYEKCYQGKKSKGTGITDTTKKSRKRSVREWQSSESNESILAQIAECLATLEPKDADLVLANIGEVITGQQSKDKTLAMPKEQCGHQVKGEGKVQIEGVPTRKSQVINHHTGQADIPTGEERATSPFAQDSMTLLEGNVNSAEQPTAIRKTRLEFIISCLSKKADKTQNPIALSSVIRAIVQLKTNSPQGTSPSTNSLEQSAELKAQWIRSSPDQHNNYLAQMFLVYQQCFSVLKSGGLMILVVKNFIRNKKVIRLDLDTIKLCEQAGFNFVERHYRELPSQSFWRVIYHQKFPDVEQIKSEDVLVFRK